MKIRSGFVGNSSSSSFICDLCWEATDLDNYDIFRCEKGHEFSKYCLQEYIETSIIDALSEDGDVEIREEECPCCKMERLAFSDAITIMEEICGARMQDIAEMVQAEAKKNGSKINDIVNKLNTENINFLQKMLNELPETSEEKTTLYNLRAQL